MKKLITIEGQGGCFPAGTLVNTPNGYKKIESIKAGDTVYSVDADTNQVVLGKVESINSHSFKEVGETSPLLVVKHSGGTLTLTTNHWVYQHGRRSSDSQVPMHYVPAGELAVGDVLHGEYDQAWVIESIEAGPEYDYVYNFEVEEHHSYIAGKVRVHNGGGGKGGESRTPVEGPSTLRSREIVRVVEIISEGEIEGVQGGLKGVYFDGTPVMNDEGTYNFTGINFDQRTGLPVQSYLKGFPDQVDAEAAVGIEVKFGVPVTRAIESDVDAALVKIRIPALFKQADNGDTQRADLSFQIEHRPVGGTWLIATTKSYNDITYSTFSDGFRIDRPAAATAGWEIRIVRKTPDSTTQKLKNQMFWDSYTAIRDIKMTYPYTAYVGITASADSVGYKIPVRAYDVKGLKTKMPSNWNPTTQKHEGTWDGSFKDGVWYHTNPAWHLYNILTNDLYGLGEFIQEENVDQYSFYNAAVYCDQLINDGSGLGTFERRFTVNGEFAAQADAWQFIQSFASIMNAAVMTSGPWVKLVQDRPAQPEKLITNSNVVDGSFEYSGTTRRNRHNTVNVRYVSPDDNWHVASVQEVDKDDVEVNGEMLIEKDAIGCTVEGQARRMARYIIDTEKYSTETVNFKVGYAHSDIESGMIVKIMDTAYAGVSQEAKVKSATGQTIVLDRPVAVLVNWTIDVVGADGKTLQTRKITNSGTVSSLSVDAATASFPGADVIITGVVSPRQFRITGMTDNGDATYTVEAVFHDPSKYARIEEGITTAPPIYSQPGDLTKVDPVKDFLWTERSYTNPNGVVTRNYDVSWTRNVNQFITSYQVFTTDPSGHTIDRGITFTPKFTMPTDLSGLYAIKVIAINAAGNRSIPAYSEKEINADGGNLNPLLLKVTNLVAKGTMSNQFTGRDLSFTWVDPNTNLQGAVVAGYQISIVNPLNLTQVLRVWETTEKEAMYTYAMNEQDGGADGANRNVIVQIRVIDTFKRTSQTTQVTFTNPAPKAVDNFVAFGMIKGMQLTYDAPDDKDYAGVLIWQGTSTSFALNRASCVFDGDSNLVSINNLNDNTTYYYRIAAYDDFGKSYTGNGLNVSGTISGVAAAIPGTPSGPVLPTTGMKDGDFFYNTTDKHLYTYNASLGKWVMIGNRQGTTAEMNAFTGMVTGDQWFNTTDNRMYTYNGTKWIPAGVQTGGTLPATGALGDVFFNTADNKMYTWDGTKWVSNNGVPSGATFPSAPKVGDQFYNTASNLLFSWSGTRWVSTGVRSGTTAQRTALTGMVSGDLFMDTTVNKLFRWTGTAWTASVETLDLSGTISSLQLADSSVTAAKTALASIDPSSGNLKANTVTALQIVGGSITAVEIKAGTITANEIAGRTITALNIKAGEITATEIKGGTITADKLNIGTINASGIYTGSLSASQITSGSIDASRITGITIAANQITSGTLSTGVLYSGSVSANQITSGTISSGVVYAGTVNADKINGGTLNTGVILTSNLSAGQITTGTLSADRIGSRSITADKINVSSLDAMAARVGDLVIGSPATRGLIKTYAKGWQGDGVDGVMIYDSSNDKFIEAKAGNAQLRISNTGGSHIKFGDMFYADSSGQMYINKANVISTLSIDNNAVTVPRTVTRYDESKTSYLANILSGSIYLTQPGVILAMVSLWHQSWNSKSDDWYLELRIDGQVVFKTQGGSISDSVSLSGSMQVGAGSHTVELWRRGGGGAAAYDRTLTILGAMK